MVAEQLFLARSSLSRGDKMENHSHFYQAVTKIAEDRIKELVQHAKDAEAGHRVFPEASSYFRACAQTVYFAWRDITEGWHTASDRERLECLVESALRDDAAQHGELESG
jgi:hypothetical protein